MHRPANAAALPLRTATFLRTPPCRTASRASTTPTFTASSTTGDTVRLGDTGLVAVVESDATHDGDECKFGGGKVLRDAQGQAANIADAEALDCVITNALIV